MGELLCSPFIYVALSFFIFSPCLLCRNLHLTCVQNPQDKQSKIKLIWPDWSFSRATNLLFLLY
jgi:hypothetical protein